VPGAQQIFHCALYFVPILICYTGCRREELCGLMVDDVTVDNTNIVTLKREIALLLNSDLADPAPDGIFPKAFNERARWLKRN
jgi:integrase